MTKRTIKSITFSSCKSRKVQADFSGGEITSDAGVLLLRQADRRLQLTQRISRQMKDPRCEEKCTHSLRDLLRKGSTPSARAMRSS